MNLKSKVIGGLVLLALAACKTESCEEVRPQLGFYQYAYKAADPNDPLAADSLTLYYQFEDCQGDVGIDADVDTTKNLQTYLFEFIDGAWVKFIPLNPADSNLLFVQIPKSDKLKKDQKAEGIIEQPLGSIRQRSDTIRFESRLVDQQGNASDWVITPDFVFPSN